MIPVFLCILARGPTGLANPVERRRSAIHPLRLIAWLEAKALEAKK